MNQPRLKILPDNTEYVVSTLGNGKSFKITKELDNELIEKSNRYKKEVKIEVNEKGMILTPIPKEWLYGLWVNLYSANGYDYYLDPINLKIYDSKFKKWRAKWIRKLFYLLP